MSTDRYIHHDKYDHIKQDFFFMFVGLSEYGI